MRRWGRGRGVSCEGLSHQYLEEWERNQLTTTLATNSIPGTQEGEWKRESKHYKIRHDLLQNSTIVQF